MDDTPNTNVLRTRTLAERLFDRDSLLESGLSANECKELYYDMRRFFERSFERSRNVDDVKKDLKTYFSCGNHNRGDPVVTSKSVVIRTGLLLGCILVRDLEGSERAGDPFPSPEIVRMYPHGYRYMVLDMFFSKQFNNDRQARER